MPFTTLPDFPNTVTSPFPSGLGIQQAAERLRHYLWISRACVKITAGWWLAVRPYETKYRLAYHLHDHASHATLLRKRLEEMRGGRPDASVRPALKQLLSETLHAPDEPSFLAGFYCVIKRATLAAIRADLATLDPSANANEALILEAIAASLEKQLAWFDTQPHTNSSTHGDNSDTQTAWTSYLTGLLHTAGGIHGHDTVATTTSQPQRPHGGFFTRPRTIHFDSRISHAPLVSYEQREKLPPREATIEQFKVFFNEMYAAALLASILFDAAEDNLPWEFHADFSRHFWDEARHSEFGAIRLRELGAAPDRCDPVLFEQSEGLPVLHRIAYLTRGLEAYFMPRKPARFREYSDRGDSRSQLFADQDWSDEINHVRFGSTWTNFLLQEDAREIDDVIDEVKQHLEKVTGHPVASIEAPF